MESVGMRVCDLYRDRAESRADNRPRIRPHIVAEYDYLSEDGELLYQVVRLEPKTFRQRRTDPQTGGWIWNIEGVRRVLYRLPELVASVGRVCWIVEGEKDVHTLESLGLLATTGAGGAGKWIEEYADQLGERPVAVIPDNDRPGLLHADQVAGSLLRAGKARSVRVLSPLLEVEHADVTDWLFSLQPSQQRKAREMLLERYAAATGYRKVG